MGHQPPQPVAPAATQHHSRAQATPEDTPIAYETISAAATNTSLAVTSFAWFTRADARTRPSTTPDNAPPPLAGGLPALPIGL
jgi:hypothetical protein